MTENSSTHECIHQLHESGQDARNSAATGLFAEGLERFRPFLNTACADPQFRQLAVLHESSTDSSAGSEFKITVGIAVTPDTFEAIFSANGSPQLAAVPSDQDAHEFELFFSPRIQLDILTTSRLGKGGAIDRYLSKFGEGIQQVELDVTDVDRATEILRSRFHLESVYPATRPGANGTRVNFFLAPDAEGKKVLVELVEQTGAAH